MNKPDKYPCYIGVKKVYRSYGGPEEGGWYYDSSITYHDITYIINESDFNKMIDLLSFTWSLKTWNGSELPPNSQDGPTFCTLWFGYNHPKDESNFKPRYE